MPRYTPHTLPTLDIDTNLVRYISQELREVAPAINGLGGLDDAAIAANVAANAANTTSLAAHRAAWTAYTPSIFPGSGSFTTASATGRYLAIGKTLFVNLVVTITTNGTAGLFVAATLPLPFTTRAQPVTFPTSCVFAGRENAVTGTMLAGRIPSSSSLLQIWNYDLFTSYPGGNGRVLYVNVTCEIN
jgi:hypothetical protein